MRFEPDAGRQIEFHPGAARIAEPGVEVEEIKPVDVPDPRRSCGVVNAAGHAHAVGRCLEDNRCAIDRLAASPLPDGSGIAGSRRHALAMGARQQQRIGIDPGDAAFRFRQHEAAVDEGLCIEVEFPQRDGIAAAARQAHDGARMFSGQRLRPVQQPVLILFGGEFVDVQHGLPLRIRLAKLCD